MIIEPNIKIATPARLAAPNDQRAPHAGDPHDPAAHSPLWMVTTEPLLNQFVLDLRQLQHELAGAPAAHSDLRFSRAHVEAIRAAFSRMIRHGEEALHQLSQVLCASFLTTYQLQSVVIGAVDSTQERFTLIQTLAPADVYSTTDIDLGNRQLSKLQFFDGASWSRATLVANAVDYQPTEPNPLGIHRISTRIKAEEQIWNKVVDELFDLDRIVRSDKQLRHLSPYVKDIFGIKIVVGTEDDVYQVHEALEALTWPDATLGQFHVAPGAATRRLEWVEVKDYLGDDDRKESGWEAVKSVVRWSDRLIEIQIQPLRNFLRERELLTRESHVSFKANRGQVRRQVAERIPLFRFYQDLLRWLFLDPAAPSPSYPSVTVSLID
jgi:Region found in RelA / SpoT proteins